VTDQLASGNRWEPPLPPTTDQGAWSPRTAAAAPGAPPPPVGSGSRRARWAAAATVLFLGSGTTGYLVARAGAEDAGLPGLRLEQGPNPGVDTPEQDGPPEAGTGQETGPGPAPGRTT
jgi:hypothetical protein